MRRSTDGLGPEGLVSDGPVPVVLGDEDAADLRAILIHAIAEREAGRGALPDLLGLERPALVALAAMVPDLDTPDLDVERGPVPADQRAVATLVAWRGGAATREALWFADVLARRAMEPRHLWEDLGLPERPRLTGLIGRHFPRLIGLNAANMRWKKFFYRQICSDAAFSLCLAPSCDACDERAACFAPE